MYNVFVTNIMYILSIIDIDYNIYWFYILYWCLMYYVLWFYLINNVQEDYTIQCYPSYYDVEKQIRFGSKIIIYRELRIKIL